MKQNYYFVTFFIIVFGILCKPIAALQRAETGGAGEGNVIPTHFVRGPLSLRYRLFRPLRRCATLPGSIQHLNTGPKIKSAKCRLNFWCGRRESNPRLKLGKLSCCHYTTPANLTSCTYYIIFACLSRQKQTLSPFAPTHIPTICANMITTTLIFVVIFAFCGLCFATLLGFRFQHFMQ